MYKIIIRDKLPWMSFRHLSGTLNFLGRLRVRVSGWKREVEEGGITEVADSLPVCVVDAPLCLTLQPCGL